MDLVPFAVPFFLLAIALEYGWGRLRGLDTYRFNDSINSLSLGIISTAVKLVGLDIGGRVFGAIEADWALARLDPSQWWNWVFAVLLYDFCYYWFHRISHERTLFWASHVAHHQSEEFNLTTALRQTGTGFLAGWIFYVPCFLAGIPASMFVTIASGHLIYQFWIHSRHIPKLGAFEWLMVTASNHRVHHARNARYVDRNYGGLLIVWDRLFGTFEEERADEPPEYGILGPLRSWNPLWANLHIYRDMLRDAWCAGNWKDRVRVPGARTGWHPPDVAARLPPKTRGAEPFTRFDPPLGGRERAYAALQFAAMLALGLWLEHGLREAPAAARWLVFGALLWGLAGIGVVMEERARGLRFEALRLLGLLCALPLVAIWSAPGSVVIAAICGYMALSAVHLWLLARYRPVAAAGRQ